MTLVCRLKRTGSAPLNSSRRITERLGSSLQKSSDICLATHRQQTRAHSRSSATLMPTPTSYSFLLHLLKAMSVGSLDCQSTRIANYARNGCAVCHPSCAQAKSVRLEILMRWLQSNLLLVEQDQWAPGFTFTP